MASPLNHDHLEFHSASKVPDSYVWPSSYLHDHPVDFESSVPVVDVSDPSASSLVGDACRSFGVFHVTGHGVPTRHLDALETEARRLFALPLRRKLAGARRPGLVSGYGPPPLSAFFPNLMWSEGFTFSPGSRPHDDHAFCEAMETYSEMMKELAAKLLSLMLRALGLDDEEAGRAGLEQAMEVLQLNSYPACPEPEKALGMAAHTDSGFLTVLYQSAGASGLQILRSWDDGPRIGPGRWVAVPPVPGALVIHVGDLLQILSNGQFKSVRHRAVVSREAHRLSAAYIVGPPSHVKVGPISKLVEPGRGPLYPSLTWPEYLGLRARFFDRTLDLVELLKRGTVCIAATKKAPSAQRAHAAGMISFALLC